MVSYGFYSMGLCGWKIWDDPQDSDRMMAQFQGTEKKRKCQKLQNSIHFIWTSIHSSIWTENLYG